jgi:hypothetical protein
MRSRLEAKWAAFFDLCGWQWTYEPFDLPGWIPDFLIDNSMLVEIKPLQAHEVPNDITHKINNAMQISITQSAVLLGNDPTIVWSRSANGIWARQLPVDWWEPLWKKACNIVQWKSPRPPLIVAEDNYTGSSGNDWEPPSYPEYEYREQTCEEYATFYENEQSYHDEIRWEYNEKGLHEQETKVICESQVYNALWRYLLDCGSRGMSLKDAKKRSDITKFQARSDALRNASKYIEHWPGRENESIFLKASAHSAALKAIAASAKFEGISNHEALNTTAEADFRAAKESYLLTNEGKTNRIAWLQDQINWYNTEAKDYIRESAIKKGRIVKLEGEISELRARLSTPHNPEMHIAPPELSKRLDRVTQTDAEFFERFPQRQYRARLASADEIEQVQVAGGLQELPSDIWCYFSAVHQLEPGVRVRKIVGVPKVTKTDVSEVNARAIFSGYVLMDAIDLSLAPD